MIGYYDGDTLTIEDGVASIDFINATNMDDRHRVTARTHEDAVILLHNVRHQKEERISALGGRAIRCSGLLMMNKGSEDEGIVETRGPNMGLVPVKLAFQIEGIPPGKKFLFSGMGWEREGAMIVERAAISDLFPIPQNVSVPSQA